MQGFGPGLRSIGFRLKSQRNDDGTPITHKGWDNPTTGKAVIWEFYQWARKCGYDTPDDIKTAEGCKDAARNLARDLRKALVSHYRDSNDEIVITIPENAVAYQPRFERRSNSGGETQHHDALLAAFQRTLHIYHLTENNEDPPKPTWWYKTVDFKPSRSPNMLSGRVANVPQAGALKERHEYNYELYVERGHLVLWAKRADGTPDISVAIFPDAGTMFPYFGFFIVTKTWAKNPASSICILSDQELDCAAGATCGEPITNPQMAAALLKAWQNHARNFVRLPAPAAPEPKLWDSDVFNKLLAEVEPANDGKADLRIVSSLFHNIFNLGLDKPLSRNCQVEILVMNPAKEDLVRSRYKLRTDFARGDRTPVEKAMDDLKEQILHLPQLPQMLRLNGGSVAVRVSDIMPCGFLAMTRKQAILGTMLAHLPYDRGGPMIAITSENMQLWHLLEADWEARWADAKDPSQAVVETKPPDHGPTRRVVSPWLTEQLDALRHAGPLHHYHVTFRQDERFWLIPATRFFAG